MIVYPYALTAYPQPILISMVFVLILLLLSGSPILTKYQSSIQVQSVSLKSVNYLSIRMRRDRKPVYTFYIW